MRSVSVFFTKNEDGAYQCVAKRSHTRETTKSYKIETVNEMASTGLQPGKTITIV